MLQESKPLKVAINRKEEVSAASLWDHSYFCPTLKYFTPRNNGRGTEVSIYHEMAPSLWFSPLFVKWMQAAFFFFFSFFLCVCVCVCVKELSAGSSFCLVTLADPYCNQP